MTTSKKLIISILIFQVSLVTACSPENSPKDNKGESTPSLKESPKQSKTLESQDTSEEEVTY